MHIKERSISCTIRMSSEVFCIRDLVSEVLTKRLIKDTHLTARLFAAMLTAWMQTLVSIHQVVLLVAQEQYTWDFNKENSEALATVFL